jgi:hypothetical protein
MDRENKLFVWDITVDQSDIERYLGMKISESDAAHIIRSMYDDSQISKDIDTIVDRLIAKTSRYVWDVNKVKQYRGTENGTKMFDMNFRPKSG